jgi:hypothetical protein
MADIASCVCCHRQEHCEIQAYKRVVLDGAAFDLGVDMNKKAILLSSLAIVVFLIAAQASAQEKSYVTVRGNGLNNGVVTVDVLKDGKTYRLSCNDGMPGCNSLKVGKYQMVELPKNFGMYECKNIEVYPELPANPEKDSRLGQYCLEER